MVVLGGVVPRQDYQFLLAQSVSAVFGANVLDAARDPRLDAGHAKGPFSNRPIWLQAWLQSLCESSSRQGCVVAMGWSYQRFRASGAPFR